MSDPTQNRPRSSHAGLRAPRHVFSPDHDVTAKGSTRAAVRAALERAGLDVEHLDERRRQSRARLEAALDRFRAESDERAPAMQHAVARSAENWRNAHRVSPALAPATGIYWLSTADTISADLGIDLLAENIGPWANTAQVVWSDVSDDWTQTDSFDGMVNFAFSWPNPTGQDLVCTVTGLLGIAATTIVTAHGYWYPFEVVTPTSNLYIIAELWPQVVDANGQITVPPLQDTQYQYVLNPLSANGSWEEAKIVGQDIFGGYVLQYENLFLPATAKLEANLSCEIDWWAYEGAAYFNAAGNWRQLSGFGLIIDTQPQAVII
jgi:hypothetical protein